MRAEWIDAGTLKDLLTRTESFVDSHETHLQRAASMATGVSQETFRRRLVGRASVPDRMGRPTTQGGFAQSIQWFADDDEYVRFERDVLENIAPYWLIQEIGTGEQANIVDEGRAVTIKSQLGRQISRFLIWAEGGQYSPVGTTDQLMAYRDVRNAPYRQDLDNQRIGREIEGKHYVQQGGRVANAVYRQSLLSLAQRTFSKQ
jgi:hypothetical protein